MRKTRNVANDGIKVKGFFRLNIVEDKNGQSKVVGDSGWIQNQVVNLGFQDYLCKTLAGGSGSKFIDHLALGTGGAPAATDTSLAGEIMSSTQRGTVSTSVISSKTIQFTAAFNSSDSFLTATSNLSNVALINTTATNGTIFSGAAYTSSACATNQSVNVTYQIRFA
jgi:hypothetical protein